MEKDISVMIREKPVNNFNCTDINENDIKVITDHGKDKGY